MRTRTGAEITAYFDAQIDGLRANPRPGFWSDLVNAEFEGRPLERGELLGMAFLLIIAGLDTVTATLDCMIEYLALASRAATSARRAARAHRRTRSRRCSRALTPVQLVPRVIARGRDDRRRRREGRRPRDDRARRGEPRPGDLRRVPTTSTSTATRSINLAFGGGPHLCLGINLARLELRVALEEWHRRIPDYAIARRYRDRALPRHPPGRPPPARLARRRRHDEPLRLQAHPASTDLRHRHERGRSRAVMDSTWRTGRTCSNSYEHVIVFGPVSDPAGTWGSASSTPRPKLTPAPWASTIHGHIRPRDLRGLIPCPEPSPVGSTIRVATTRSPARLCAFQRPGIELHHEPTEHVHVATRAGVRADDLPVPLPERGVGRLPRMRHCTLRPCTTRVSKSLESDSSARFVATSGRVLRNVTKWVSPPTTGNGSSVTIRRSSAAGGRRSRRRSRARRSAPIRWNARERVPSRWRRRPRCRC